MEITDNQSVALSGEGIAHLTTARRWASFLTIAGFIYVGFSALAFITSLLGGRSVPVPESGIMPSTLTTLPTTSGYNIGMLIVTAVWCACFVYMRRFVTKSRKALLNLDSNELTESISSLLISCKIYVIYTLGSLAIALLLGIIFLPLLLSNILNN
ncbi:MAG: hypothetical protein LBR06_04535 [Bacteroidales bacterium]|jgi:hypothetical protein|nr:hypothetical protein [Bacteroidales bacterium]